MWAKIKAEILGESDSDEEEDDDEEGDDSDEEEAPAQGQAPSQMTQEVSYVMVLRSHVPRVCVVECNRRVVRWGLAFLG